MDAKDLRTESGVSERNNDGSKYSQSGGLALHCDRNKSYQDIGSNSLGKVDIPNARPCAVIGPDRVVPPPAVSEAYHIKKAPIEPWQCLDSAYRRPPEYPHKLSNFQNPTRNISPRQTFQENMQRIMVPPTYNSIKINDDTNYTQMLDRNNGLSKNIKLNVPPEAKFCDVPYVANPNNNNDQKSVRNPDMCLPSVNPTVARTAPHGWPPGSVNLRSSRMYGAPEIYQYQDYSSCAGPRPVVPRSHRTVPEEQGYVYADPYYQDGNIRFKPYPSVKERYPQQRYDYIGNYPHPFPPPPGFPAHKYDIPKGMPPHPYPPYAPVKYLDSRVTEPVIEGYPRNPQNNYNIQYRNHVIHPNYGPVIGNCPPQNKMHPYPPDAHVKTIAPNKLPYDNNAKAYIEYDNNRPKMYPPSDNYFVNEMTRMPVKSQVIMPNYPGINMHNVPPNPYYKKDNQMKSYEHMAHFRSMDPNLNIHNVMSRHPPVFSPNTLAISPTDSTASNDTSHTLGTSQEDCGYVSQSSTASVRSIDSGINRIPNEFIRKYYDSRYGPIVRASPMMSKSHMSCNNNTSKDKKSLDVRQFLQMWNEGDEESEENGSKEIIIATGSSEKNNFAKTHESMNSQEQLYVLGLVNVPSEELAKYEHIQKVSKLPENIKGYNSIELLHQFEEVIESSNMTNYKSPNPTEYHLPVKGVPKQVTGVVPPRPVSPLDVEAKISQSVIHKEVGCNFEIKPCSPKMLNVEVAAPVQNILAERAIEKVANPVMIKSPMLNATEENIDCNVMKRPDHRPNMNDNLINPSCKMINSPFSNNNNTIDSIKSSYSLHDLESNSGLCFASLPRLDNDMELNFPEVNQQFINANKGDSSGLTSSLRDLPTLDVLDQTNHQVKEKFEKNSSSTQENDMISSPYMVDSDREVSRLSKYRKSKTPPVPKENLVQQNINAIRTDSVIIKNPENIKNYEDHSENSTNNLNKAIVEIQRSPINLTAQGNSVNHVENASVSINLPDLDNERSMSVATAIDFSLNKTDFANNLEPETKAESEIQSRVDRSLNTLIIKSNNQTDPSENLMNTEPKCENINNHLENNDECDAVKYLLAKTDNNPDLFATGHSNEVNRNTTRESNALETVEKANKELSNDSSVEISTTESLVNASEFANDDNNYTPMEIESTQNESTKKESQESKYDFIEHDLVDDQNHVRDFEGIYHNKNENSKSDTNFTKNEDTCEGKDMSNNFSSKNNQQIDTEFMDQSEDDPDIVSDKIEAGPTGSQSIDFNDFADEEMYDNDFDEAKSTQSPKVQNLELHSSSGSLENSEMGVDTHASEEHTKEIDQIKDLGENISEGVQQSVIAETVPKENLDSEDKLKNFAENCNDDKLKDSEGNYCVDDKLKNYKESCQQDTLKHNKENVCDDDTSEDENNCKDKLPENEENNDEDLTDEKENCEENKSDSKEDKLTDEEEKYRLNDFIENFNVELKNEDENCQENKSNSNDSKENYKLKDFKENYSQYLNDEKENCQESKSNLKEDKSTSNEEKYKLNDCKENFDEELKYQKENCKENKSDCKKDTLTDNEENYKFNDFNGNFDDALKDDEENCQESKSNCKEDKLTGNEENNTLNDFKGNCDEDINNEEKNSQEHKSDCKEDTQTDNEENYFKENCDVDIKNIEVNFQANNSTNEEEISNEEKFNNFEELSVDDTQQATSIKIKNIHEVSQNKLHKPPPDKKCLWYGSKELYSPWIQKLWFLAEGIINNRAITTSDSTGDDYFLYTENYSPDKHYDYAGGYRLKSPQNRISGEVIVLDNGVFNCENDVNIEETDSEVIETSVFCSVNNLKDVTNVEDEHVDKTNVSLIKESLDLTHDLNEEKETETVVDTNLIHENLEDTTEVVNNKLTALEIASNADEATNITMDYVMPQGSTASPRLNEGIDSKEPDIPVNLQEVLCEGPQNVRDGVDEGGSDDTQGETFLLEDIPNTCYKLQPNKARSKKGLALKRSLSDSALNLYNDQDRSKQDHEENVQIIWPYKRRKVNDVDNELLAQNLCNIIHSNRRNSISSIYNDENVSFCILIDNSCIITEEENGVSDKICYTELTEDCLTEIQNNELKHDEHPESFTEAMSSTQPHGACSYSDTLLMECDGEEDKNLEESWVEDVACVETVISDDIAEDIEISGPSSPKDDDSSDNDESGVFSSNEHSDKVKYIYGDKMCNDDAQIVDTLYKTPQMDVNKALFSREPPVSYENYYDNDSLEKMLSASNDAPVSPYVPQYIHSNEKPENKENVNVDSISSFQNKAVPLDRVADINVENIELETKRPIDYFDKTQDDTVHSCESSVDNVFTYKQKEEDAIYSTSSSPEVSSTTSEEKNSGIRLKITNFKGSRISQINDMSSVKRSSCKFTEDKEYLQSQNSFPTNRPLLTKGAQKYIPPLKESIRDLKVKLSLPQHSLMKLKQLKISKDEPKFNKHSSSSSPLSKKPKPKFEDVLKSIDEIQFKMHKEKSKKSKKSIPKVVIKKNENGSHYASSSNKDNFNPDLTGRKWQPWVFIEKNTFIDKMAIRKKTKAIYSHRKRTYVLAEKFQKYKSASSAKFVISPPVSDTSSGLKYTIRLKHNY